MANHEKSGYNPVTKRDWGGDVTKGGLDSIDGIFILQMSKRVVSEVLSWRRGTGGGKERGGNFFLNHGLQASCPFTLQSAGRSVLILFLLFLI